jgi:hypothetical protein
MEKREKKLNYSPRVIIRLLGLFFLSSILLLSRIAVICIVHQTIVEYKKRKTYMELETQMRLELPSVQSPVRRPSSVAFVGMWRPWWAFMPSSLSYSGGGGGSCVR